MKRLCLLWAVLCLATGLCACKKDEIPVTDPDLFAAPTSSVTVPDANADANAPSGSTPTPGSSGSVVYQNDLPGKTMRDVMGELADGNFYVFLHITDLYGLPRSETVTDGHYYEIKSEYFTSLSKIETYLKSLYTEETVASIMSSMEGLYVEKNGKLYIDTDLMKARGYHVNWGDYRLDLLESKEDTCTFKVTGRLVEPGEDQTGVPYSVQAKAVKENGKWRLTKMFY